MQSTSYLVVGSQRVKEIVKDNFFCLCLQVSFDCSATVVQNYSTFWTGIKSEIIQVTKHAADNSSQSSGISTTRKPIMTTTITNPPFVPKNERTVNFILLYYSASFLPGNVIRMEMGQNLNY